MGSINFYNLPFINLNTNKTGKSNKSNISFKNNCENAFHDILSSKLFEHPDEIKVLSAKYFSHSKGVVGHIPEELKCAAPDELKVIKKIGSTCDKFRRDLINQNQVITELKNTFKENNIIQKDSEFSLNYIGKGGHGIVYGLNIKDQKYALKIFYKKQDTKNKSNGCFMETNRALFLDKNLKDNPFIKFHFADLENSCMLTQFADESNSAERIDFNKLQKDLLKLGLTFNDYKGKNIIGNKIVDYGYLELSKF